MRHVCKRRAQKERSSVITTCSHHFVRSKLVVGTHDLGVSGDQLHQSVTAKPCKKKQPEASLAAQEGPEFIAAGTFPPSVKLIIVNSRLNWHLHVFLRDLLQTIKVDHIAPRGSAGTK